MIKLADKYLVGLFETDLQSVVYHTNCLAYIVERDGVFYQAPESFMSHRVLVGITDNKVSKVYGWG